MADRIEAKINLEENAPARVAFDIAKDIMRNDSSRIKDSGDFRSYYLDLYAECLRAVRGVRQFGVTTEGKSNTNHNAANS